MISTIRLADPEVAEALEQNLPLDRFGASEPLETRLDGV